MKGLIVKLIRLGVAVSVGCIFFVYETRSVLAQDMMESSSPAVSGLAVSPAVVETVIEPGVVKVARITVHNITTVALPIRSTVERFNLDGSKASPAVSREVRARFDSSEWVEVNPADFILQPGESRPIELVFEAPNDADPGGHYSIVYFQPLVPAQLISTQSTNLSARVGVLNLLLVKGEIRQEIKINSLETQRFNQLGPINFSAAVANTGNVHIIPTGYLSILDFRGKEIERIDISPSLLLPNSEGAIQEIWDKRYLFGAYEARLILNSPSAENSGLLVSESARFIVVPLTIVVPLILGLTLFITGTILYRRRVAKALFVLFAKPSRPAL